MSLSGIKALTFDTGGTLLDWHTGFREAFAQAGQRHGFDRDWGQIANRFRRLSLEMMLDLGDDGPQEYNFDQAHALSLKILLREEGLDEFDDADRHRISWEAPHRLAAWPDVREGLAALRERYIVASFTLLSYRLVIDTSRRNGLTWDAVLSCEGLGVYKLLPEAYLRAAKRLQLAPEECLAFRLVRIIAGVQMVVHYYEGIPSLYLSEAAKRTPRMFSSKSQYHRQIGSKGFDLCCRDWHSPCR